MAIQYKCFRCKCPCDFSSKFCRECYLHGLEYSKRILRKVISDHFYWTWRNSSVKLSSEEVIEICQDEPWEFYLRKAAREKEFEDSNDRGPLIGKLQEQVRVIEKVVQKFNRRPVPPYVKEIKVIQEPQSRNEDTLAKLLALEKRYEVKEESINKDGWKWWPVNQQPNRKNRFINSN
jgi:hypothetical protein